MLAAPANDIAPLPTIIQGGMGADISDWRLARAVSSRGQLGVVSGTALDVILARRLQLGDPGGHMRRGLDRFPVPTVTERIWQRYYVPGGKAAARAFRPLPLGERDMPRELAEPCLAGNLIEVLLAREGAMARSASTISRKIQLPHLPSIVTAGDDLARLARFMPPGSTRYTAADVIAKLLSA